MINLAHPDQTSIRELIAALFDRLVRQHTEAYALVVAFVTLIAIAVIH